MSSQNDWVDITSSTCMYLTLDRELKHCLRKTPEIVQGLESGQILYTWDLDLMDRDHAWAVLIHATMLYARQHSVDSFARKWGCDYPDFVERYSSHPLFSIPVFSPEDGVAAGCGVRLVREGSSETFSKSVNLREENEFWVIRLIASLLQEGYLQNEVLKNGNIIQDIFSLPHQINTSTLQ